MSIRLSRRAALISSAGLGAALPFRSWAQEPANDHSDLAYAVDMHVKRCMGGFPDQPAVSIAVVKNGQAVLAKGYGERRLGEAAPVDEHTLFAIASNTKNVTCAALAMMVDEGKVKWDAPVRTYLPDFRLSDPMISERITVRDLVSHRAGFGLGAGDLLFWPNSDRTRAEVVALAAHVPIEDGFRAGYHYNNLMFVVAGAVLEAVSGMSWETFIQTRILDRVGMSETVPLARLADPAKSAMPHGRLGPPLRYQGAMQPIGDSIAEVWNWDSAAAAGGICTNPVDWAKWIALRLANGALPDGSRLYSEAQAREMFRPNIIVSSSAGPTPDLPGRSIAATYAMGWQVMDYRGERFITHGGGAPGYLSGTVLIPGRNVGFSYFTNAEESYLVRALRNGIADLCMAERRQGPDFDWISDSAALRGESNNRSRAAAVEIDAKQAAGAAPSLPLEAYAGTWRDPWYGDITISPSTVGRGRNRRTQLWLAFSHTPSLNGPLEPYDGETMRTRFPDKREEDLFITFTLEGGAPRTATMKAVSPDADFSYDYHDLRLTKL